MTIYSYVHSPRCGTTWTQAICAFLILETNELPVRLAEISPWINSELDPLSVCLNNLDAQKHRRFIKSRTPLDGIPFYEKSIYFVVYRHPVDAFFSRRKQGLNMKQKRDLPIIDPDPRKAFAAWLDEPFTAGAAESRSLEAFVYHYYTLDAYRHLDQLNFFHFADMKRDLPGTVRRIAETLGITASDARVDKICELVSFSSMKKKASTFSLGCR